MSNTLIITINLLSFLFISNFVPTYLLAEDINSDKTYKIGVLAYKGKKSAVERWNAHGVLLSQKLSPLKFEIIPLSYKHNELTNAVINRQLDFVITNPGHYTELELGGHISRMATRRMSGPQGVLDQFGGTAITLPDRHKINNYADLAGKKILIPSQSSLGGWQVHLREAITQGVDLRQDAQIIELKNHKKVVDSVLTGEADAGFVRSDLIESLVAKGLLDLNQIKVVNKRQESAYPYLLSTQLYPEWPFAIVSGTSIPLAKKVLHVLMAIQPNDKAAIDAKLFGWTIPGHYSSVIELFRETGLGPFKPKALTWKKIIKYYWLEFFLLTLLVFIFLILGIIKTLQNNKVLSNEITKRKKIEQELVRHKQHLEQEVIDRTSELENAQKEIIKSELLLKNVIHGANLGFWDWYYQTQEYLVSDHWLAIIGEKHLLINNSLKDWSKRIHQNDKSHIKKVIAESIDKNMPYRVEFRMRHTDGHWVWIESSGRVVERDPKTNKPIRLCGTHQDISKRKRAEEALQEQHKYLQSIIDSIVDPIMVIREDYTVELMNSSISDTLNSCQIANSEQPKCYEISHHRSTPCNSSEHLCPLEQVIKSKKHTIVVHEHYNPDRSKCYVELSASPLLDKQQNCIGIIEAARDITTHLKAQDTLREQKSMLAYQAHHDVLTNLPNRTLFNDRLEQGIEKSKRNKTKLALFFIDLDHFKEINDSLGHEVGDEILKSVTKRLNDVIRDEDTLARLGGDEFTIIIEDLIQGQNASLLAQKIITSLAEPFTISEHRLYISSSIGISLYPDDGSTSQNLLKYADAAMYKAKDEGRNNFKYYSADMTKLAFERVVMETSLREAVKNEEFVVYYQPQIKSEINNDNNRLLGVEALVRWQHPSMGLVSPATFIPLAESTGLIIELDQLVMKIAMKQMTKWYDQRLNPGRLALNLAIKQLQQKDFIGILDNILKETQCKPKWLEFEVAESQVMRNPEESIKLLKNISKLGIQLAIDDFGTGYSSLSYLKKLPINKLKIDQSFVRDLPGDAEDAAIIKAVIALAQSLNLNIIAEGVETKEQRDFLIKNDCEDIQGYFYSKPITADKMEKYLKENKLH